MRKINIRFLRLGIILGVITALVPYGIHSFLPSYAGILNVFVLFMYGANFWALFMVFYERAGKARRIDYVVRRLTVVTVLGVIQIENPNPKKSKTLVTFRKPGAKDTDVVTVILKTQQHGLWPEINYRVGNDYQLHLCESHTVA